jgi:hypothetical protein
MREKGNFKRQHHPVQLKMTYHSTQAAGPPAMWGTSPCAGSWLTRCVCLTHTHSLMRAS